MRVSFRRLLLFLVKLKRVPSLTVQGCTESLIVFIIIPVIRKPRFSLPVTPILQRLDVCYVCVVETTLLGLERVT